MKTRFFVATIISLSFFFTRCKDAPNWDDGENDSTPPAPISNPIVKNINGGAVIFYTLPEDKDLLGVKALYTYHDGDEQLEAYSSAFTDSIQLVGFPDTNERKVTLIAFDNSKNESQPVEVTIKPLTLPVELIRNSLTIRETFSGVYAKWENPTRADIGVSLYAEDDLGYMNLDYTYYTRESGQYSFRGFESKERKFRIVVKDRWDNTSSPLDTTLIPIFEEEVVARDMSERSTWVRYGYSTGQADNHTEWRGDYRSVFSSADFWHMFNPVNTSASYFHPGLWTSFYLNLYTDMAEHANIEPKPMHLTIDMTRETKLSRCKVLFRNDGSGFNPNDAYHLSIYATNETPKQPSDFSDQIESLRYWTTWPQIDGTGEWMNDWTHIGEFYFIPPSGATEVNQWTDDDKAWSRAGIDKDFFEEHSNTPFRYLRIVAHESLEKSQLVHFVYWEFYGNVVNK